MANLLPLVKNLILYQNRLFTALNPFPFYLPNNFIKLLIKVNPRSILVFTKFCTTSQSLIKSITRLTLTWQCHNKTKSQFISLHSVWRLGCVYTSHVGKSLGKQSFYRRPDGEYRSTATYRWMSALDLDFLFIHISVTYRYLQNIDKFT